MAGSRGLGAGGGRKGAQAGAADPGDARRRCRGSATPSSTTAWKGGRRSPPGPACRWRRWWPWSSRRTDARYLRFDTFDANYYNGWDRESALHPQTILAYAFNDRPLDARARRAAAPLLAGQAGLQADQVPDEDDLHHRAARRLLGGPGVPLAGRDLKGSEGKRGRRWRRGCILAAGGRSLRPIWRPMRSATSTAASRRFSACCGGSPTIPGRTVSGSWATWSTAVRIRSRCCAGRRSGTTGSSPCWAITISTCWPAPPGSPR